MNIHTTATTASRLAPDLGPRELTDAEIDLVHGGDAWAGTPEGRAPASGLNSSACANSILFWSGVGGTVGAIGGSFLTVLGGWAIGGGLAARYSPICYLAR